MLSDICIVEGSNKYIIKMYYIIISLQWLMYKLHDSTLKWDHSISFTTNIITDYSIFSQFININRI